MDALIARTQWRILAKRLEQLGVTEVTVTNKEEWIVEHNKIVERLAKMVQEKIHVPVN